MHAFHQDTATFRERLEQLSAQIEEFKRSSDADLRLLQSRLHAQIERLQLELAELECQPSAGGVPDYAARLEAYLQELAARGDAVYHLLRGQLDKVDDQTPPGQAG